MNPLVRDIQKKVCAHYGLTMREMLSDRRGRYLSRPRQIAMFLARESTIRSLPEIGRLFNRDHTTVIHAVRETMKLIERDPEAAEDIARIRASMSDHREMVAGDL